MSVQHLPSISLGDASFTMANSYHHHLTETYKNSFSAASSPESGSNMDYPRSPSPTDARTKNARAQARHRAKRKAYIENLEHTVRQLRTAVTSGSSPQAVAQAQLLERENVRLRAEAQFLRARLSSIDTSPPLLPTVSSSSVPSSSLFTPASAFGSSQNRNEYSLRLPSVSDTMGQSNSSSSSSASSTYAGQQRSYASSMDNSNGARGYESAAEYRRRVTSPYSLDYSSTRHSYSQEYPQSTLQQSSSSSVAPLTGSALSPSPYLQSSQPAASASSSSTLGEYYEQDYGTGASTYTTYPTNVEEPSPVFPATAAAPVANYPSYASPYLLGGTNYTGSHEDVKPFVQ